MCLTTARQARRAVDSGSTDRLEVICLSQILHARISPGYRERVRLRSGCLAPAGIPGASRAGYSGGKGGVFTARGLSLKHQFRLLPRLIVGLLNGAGEATTPWQPVPAVSLRPWPAWLQPGWPGYLPSAGYWAIGR